MRKAKVIYGLIFPILLILFSATLLDASILFVAPHPDDDVITSSGVIYAAVQRGEPLRVVFMTNGDLYGGASLGYTREDEAVTGESVLGVTEGNLIFLGYPDGYLNTIYTSYQNATDRLVTSNGISATYGDRGLGRMDYHTYRFGSPASYNMVNILTDLEDILSTYQPDQILVTSEYDLHPDHSATYQLLRTALLNVNSHIPNYIPVIHTTIVHWNDNIWPTPTDPTSLFSPLPELSSSGTTWTQTGLSWTDRESINVPISMQSINYTSNPKYLAISAHASQGGTGGFLGQFIHKDEIFWPENDLGSNHPPIVNSGPDQTALQGWKVYLDGSLSWDPDGDPLSFHWVQRSGIQVQLSDPTSVQPVFVAPTGLSQDAIMTFELAISDGHFSTIPDSVSVTIPASSPPGALTVTPATGSAASGAPGGPFGPSSATYSLENVGGTTINWSASVTQSWITLSSNSGSLASGASTTVTVSINSNANSLAAGSYSDTVTFTNTTNGNGSTTRGVTFIISAQPINIAPLATVTASSETPQYGQTAMKAVDGVIDGYPGDYTHEWATAGQGVGAWLSLNWSAPYSVNKIVLYDRPNLNDNITSATITFSDGSSIAVGPLNNDGTATTYTFPARVITGLTMMVTGVSSTTQNVGLSEIQVFVSPPCTASAPTVSITSPSQTITSGGSDTYTISIKNNDSSTACTSTTFSLTASDTNSANFNASTVSPASVVLSPGGSSTSTLTVTAKAAQTSGADSTSVTASASGHANGVSNGVTTTIVAPVTALAVNAGGGQYTDTSGNVYKADTDYSGGYPASTTAAITGTSDPTLYQTERYGNFSYNIPLANGNYSVTLKFAEIYWTAAGKRVFNVSMQGTQVVSNLDIFAQAGKDVAYDVTIPVSVTNGTLSITFTSVIDNAKVSAIEVTSGTTGLAPDTTPPTIPAGVTATAVSSSQINISWAASTDPVVTGQITSGVAGYKIYRNGTQAGTATTTNYADTGLTASTTYSYTVSAYDVAGNISAQSTAATATTQASSSSGTVVFADNAGGGQYIDTSGNVYKADTDYSGGYPASTTAAITGTSDPTLYQTERYGNFSYSIPLANGNYSVTLKFAEIYWTAAGKRVFNVSVQGIQVISNLDIYAQAGKDVAYDITIPVSVTNGTLSITFTSVVDNAKVSAIEVTSGTTGLAPDTTPPTIPAGVTATAVSSSQINISWAASTDPVVTGQITSGVAGYKIYRNGTQAGTATTTNYADTGLTASTTYSYTVSAYDVAGNISAQSTAATATTLASSSSGTVVFADNSGGGQYTDHFSAVYQADADYSGGYPASTTATITGTVDPTLYQTERYGNFSYNIPLANGNYNVTLKFAEIYWIAAGKRVFDVSMQGTQVVSNLDIFAQVGKDAAYDVTIPVSVTNGTLNITFSTVIDNAKVSAIEVATQ